LARRIKTPTRSSNDLQNTTQKTNPKELVPNYNVRFIVIENFPLAIKR